jgi:hypothetical protein
VFRDAEILGMERDVVIVNALLFKEVFSYENVLDLIWV